MEADALVTTKPPIISVKSSTVSKEFLRGLIREEKVHPMGDLWNDCSPMADLYMRLGESAASGEFHLPAEKKPLPPRREIFAQLNPANPDAALISIQAAYTNKISSNVVEIITCRDVPYEEPHTVVLYSLSAWKDSGKGLSYPFIKDVSAEIGKRRPEIKTYVTLSPITGLRDWVINKLDQAFLNNFDRNHAITRKAEALKADILRSEEASPDKCLYVEPGLAWRRRLLDAEVRAAAALYVIYGEERVARLHQRNGAVVYRLCVGANRTARGCRESFGLMMNYLYKAGSSVAPVRTVEAIDGGLPYSQKMAALLLPRQ